MIRTVCTCVYTLEMSVVLQIDIIHQINDYFGADYDMDTKWSDLFMEAPEEQEAMRLSRLRSGSLPTSPRVGKGAPGGVGSLAAAVAAVMQQQQHWPATGTAAAGRAGVARKSPAAWQQLQGDLLDSDSDDESYSEQESGELMRGGGNGSRECSDGGIFAVGTKSYPAWLCCGRCRQLGGLLYACSAMVLPQARSEHAPPQQHQPPPVSDGHSMSITGLVPKLGRLTQ